MLNSLDLKQIFSNEFVAIEQGLRDVIAQNPPPHGDLRQLWESLEYSLFSGGKRFRPLLAMLATKALGHPANKCLPFAAAIELIHTYSLIHDDLPCMDNDDLRRGRPTNHRVFGEDVALLAGDGLLTLAFSVLAKGYADSPAAGLEVVRLVSQAAGVCGMVGGQVLDMSVKTTPPLELLQEIHRHKTGDLIRAAFEGAATVCMATKAEAQALKSCGEQLGLAFQLADDLEDDQDAATPERVNYVNLLGRAGTHSLLLQTSQAAHRALDDFGSSAEGLRTLIDFNQQRVSLRN